LLSVLSKEYQTAPNKNDNHFHWYPWYKKDIYHPGYVLPEPVHESIINVGSQALPRLKTGVKKRNIIIGVFLLITIVICFSLLNISARRLDLQAVTFSSKPVTLGLPNTVIFKYDASHSNADSVFIQQSWDPKKRIKVDPQLHEFTSTYYLPGYYRAKLILNDSIIREHDVKIETDGWMGMLENGDIPIYLSNKQFQEGRSMSLDENDLRDLNVNADKEVRQ
jgi:hypothetical protein